MITDRSVAMLFALAWTAQAAAHGDAAWIAQGGFRNSNGDLCCGERDCIVLADGDVSPSVGGFFVRSANEVVPYHEATPSPDKHYWRCQWGGTRKCFFAPYGST